METQHTESVSEPSTQLNARTEVDHAGLTAGERLESLCKVAGTRMTFSMRILVGHPAPPFELGELANYLQIIAADTTTAVEKANAAVEAAAHCINELSADEAQATRRVLSKLVLHLNPTFSAYRKAMRYAETSQSGISIEMDDLVVAIKITENDSEEKLARFLEAMGPLWLDVIELSLGASDEQVKLWPREDVQTVIDSIRCYYSLVPHVTTKYPRKRPTGVPSRFKSTASTLASYVNVGLPLWRRLHHHLESIPDCLYSFGVSSQRANRQQAAIWRYLLDHTEVGSTAPLCEPRFTTILGSSPNKMNNERSAFESHDAAGNVISDQRTKTSKRPLLQVVHGPIPKAYNREDAELLKQYEPLANAMLPLAVMPTLSAVGTIEDTLKAEYPWAQPAIDEIASLLRLRCHFGCTELMLPPVLLVGPPGSGKSRFARRLAQLLSLPFQNVSLGGSHDVKLITGTSRGWGSTTPTPLLTRILQSQSASVLVLLDEIDKCSPYNNSSRPLANALLSLLEAETAANFRDGCLQTRCDLSRLIYVATANSLVIDKALLSRFTVLHVPEPRPEDVPSLAKSMLGDLAEEMGFPREAMPEVPAEVINVISGNARAVREVLRRFLSQWAEETLSKERLH